MDLSGLAYKPAVTRVAAFVTARKPIGFWNGVDVMLMARALGFQREARIWMTNDILFRLYPSLQHPLELLIGRGADRQDPTQC